MNRPPVHSTKLVSLPGPVFHLIPIIPQPFRVVPQPALQQHVEVLHPSPVDLKEVSEDVFFCNISHQQVLSSTPPFCNSCRQSILAFLRLGILVLGSLGICFVQIKTQTQNRFCTKEQDAVSQSDDPFFSRELLQRGRTGVEEKKLSRIRAGTQPHKQKTGFEEKQLTCICAGILIEHRSIL